MAVQTIYTGQGIKAPQDKGHVMQALSQFSSQDLQRKTAEINKGMKDRDDFLNLLKVDPVYLASTEANKKIADSMQSFTDKWTQKNKLLQGNLSTNDLAELTQDRGALMAMQQYYTGINQEMMQAQKAMVTNPGRWDEVHFQEAVNEWRTTGTRPAEGFILPAVKNPFQEYQGFVQGMRFGKLSPNIEEVQTGPNTKKVYTTPRWDTKGYDDDRLKGEFASSPTAQYSIRGGFERYTDDATKQKYLDKAEGDAAYAANLWFKENAPSAFPSETDVSTRVYREPIDYRTREEQKTYEADGVFIFDNEPAFASGNQVTATIGDGPGMDIVGDELIPLPADKMDFNVDVEFEKGALVWVKPQTAIFENDKMEHAVDPTKNGQVWIIANKEDDVPMSEIIDSQELPNGKIRYKGTLKALTASSDVSLAQPKLDGIYKNNFSTQYNKWKAESGVATPKKSGFKFPKIGQRGKKSEVKYTLPDGSVYTEDQLRSAKWTDADIAKLKKVK